MIHKLETRNKLVYNNLLLTISVKNPKIESFFRCLLFFARKINTESSQSLIFEINIKFYGKKVLENDLFCFKTFTFYFFDDKKRLRVLCYFTRKLTQWPSIADAFFARISARRSLSIYLHLQITFQTSNWNHPDSLYDVRIDAETKKWHVGEVRGRCSSNRACGPELSLC